METNNYFSEALLMTAAVKLQPMSQLRLTIKRECVPDPVDSSGPLQRCAAHPLG